MRKTLLLTAAALAVVATPAFARDGSVYGGIEGGLLFPKDQDADLDVTYTTTNATIPPGGTLPAGIPAGPASTHFDNTFGLDYKRGYDIDGILGYDFGAFRIEGELGYKRSKLNEIEVDSSDIAAINTALNRPAGVGDPTVPGLAAISATNFDLGGHVSVLSGMVNALADFGDENGISFYAGGGFGRAKVKAFSDSDSAWAWQIIAGMRYAISPNIDLGLKYRYFRTGNINLADDSFALAGNANALVVNQVAVAQTTNALVFADYENKFRSHSLLASLIFNFGSAAVEAPLPPPPPPPPPVVEAPATQTCPDGSVILATSSCPLPPPPPPPPPVERGERGQ